MPFWVYLHHSSSSYSSCVDRETFHSNRQPGKVTPAAVVLIGVPDVSGLNPTPVVVTNFSSSSSPPPPYYYYYYYYYHYHHHHHHHLYLLSIGYSLVCPQTNHVPSWYTVAATLPFYCQYAVRCVSPSFLRWFWWTSTSALSGECVQCLIWLFSVVPELHGFLVCCPRIS